MYNPLFIDQALWKSEGIAVTVERLFNISAIQRSNLTLKSSFIKLKYQMHPNVWIFFIKLLTIGKNCKLFWSYIIFLKKTLGIFKKLW